MILCLHFCALHYIWVWHALQENVEPILLDRQIRLMHPKDPMFTKFPCSFHVNTPLIWKYDKQGVLNRKDLDGVQQCVP